MSTKTRRRSTPSPATPGGTPETPAPLDRYGSVAQMKAKDLTVLEHIQRTPSRVRTRKIAHEWDDARVGILLVARIVEGPNRGKFHVYDGGTRLVAKMLGDGTSDAPPDPEYTFICWVRDMTEKQAAAAFGAMNIDSAKPGAFDQYKVGVVEGRPDMLAIKEALDILGLKAYSHSSYGNPPDDPGKFGAIKTAQRIVQYGVNAAFADGVDDEDEMFAAGAARLVKVISMGRKIYQNDGAHDADLLIALDRILERNQDKTFRWEDHLVEVVSRVPVSTWRSKATMKRNDAATYGGSVSRGIHMAQVIVAEANHGKRNKLAI
jgi:hypothetical protein